MLNEDPDPAVGALASACLHVADLPRALAWWCDGLGLLEVDRGDDFAVLSAGGWVEGVLLGGAQGGRGGRG